LGVSGLQLLLQFGDLLLAANDQGFLFGGSSALARGLIRQDVSLLQKRAKDAEQKLTQQQHMVIRLEDKAARESATANEKETLV
ncbi:hypothetical protein ACCS64_38975, partial [Rhizobium ruizarguesonis]